MGRKSKGRPREKITIRLDLTGALKEKFEYLREYYGIKISKQLAEYLIIQKYEELKKEEKSKAPKTTLKQNNPLLVTSELHLKEMFLVHTILEIAQRQTLPSDHLDLKQFEQHIRRFIITRAEQKGREIPPEHIDKLTKDILEYHKEILEGLAIFNIEV